MNNINSEGITTNEAIKPAAESLPEFDPSKEYNGMYADEKEYKEAESLYSLNTVSLEEPTDYPLVTVEDIPSTPLETDTEFPITEAEGSGSVSNPEDFIDVEAKVISIDPESNDDTEDIAAIVDSEESINFGDQKIEFSPRLKNLAKGVFQSIDHFLSSDSDIPETLDTRTMIMSEPDFDPDYDYELISRLLDKHYRRKRAEKLSEIYLRSIQNESLTMPNIPPPPNENPPLKTDSEGPKENNPLETSKEENDQAEAEALAIEYSPSTNPETPALEYDAKPIAIGYEPPPNDSPQIEQQPITNKP